MGLELGKIRALCFDVDGTLSDTDDQLVHRLEKRLRVLNIVAPKADLTVLARWLVMGTETPGNLLYMALDRLHLDDDIARIYSRIAQRKKERIGNKFWMIPEVQDVLHELSKNYPMAVVSARDRNSTNRFLDQFEISPLFKAVATSQTCQYTKPFPDPVLWAAEQLGVAPEECLMIGDTTVDIHAGKSAGAQTVGVLCGFGREKELRRAGADLILSSTACLRDLLI